MQNSIAKILFIIVSTFAFVGCATTPSEPARFRTWDEEVKLNDGRVIVVSQKYLCDPEATWLFSDRDTWLTIDIPEFRSKPIVWHEKLRPLVLNVHQGKLFVVRYPGTRVELKYYGNPQPPYVGFRYDDGQWRRIPFTDIPEAIYETNRIVALTDVHGNFANLTQKAKAREYRIAYERRIDPAHRYVP